MTNHRSSRGSEGPWIWEFHTARVQNAPLPSLETPRATSPVRARTTPRSSSPSSRRGGVILRSTISSPRVPQPKKPRPRPHPQYPNAPIGTPLNAHPQLTNPPITSPPNVQLASPHPPITTPSNAHPQYAHPPVTAPYNAHPQFEPQLIFTSSSVPPSIAYSSATPPSAASPSATTPAAPPPAPQPPQTPPGRGPRKQLDVHTRTQICTLKKIAGWSYSQIHAQFPHIPQSTIKTTVKREATRHNNQTSHRSGAPRKLHEEDTKKLLDALDENPRLTWDELIKVIDGKAGRHSIRRLLEIEGRRKGQPDRKLKHTQKMLARLTEPDPEPDSDSNPEPEPEP
ncbi:hypothetical protein N7478_011833 [Penicillium angulare]|uniref:uncharacterized protein n=1 Tax=Penicillium angulare TaxID=116970 RepID=UPI002540D465|nr:uncharacterized protein N7478_011833 [Penicillium angulare]KAJ5261238.1 hypothetical protein N7478_011833 [Penicillium angulare]